MRRWRSVAAAIVFVTVLATTFSRVVSTAKAQDATRLVREGQLLPMSATEITIQKDGMGKQAYSLGQAGQWSLNAQGIVPGDRIRYTVYGSSGYAHDFQKRSK